MEEDLEEVADSLYAIIAEGHDIMPAILQTQRVRHVCIATCLIMRPKIVLSCS